MSDKIKDALLKNDYQVNEVIISESNRPDLGEFQYNGAMNLPKFIT